MGHARLGRGTGGGRGAAAAFLLLCVAAPARAGDPATDYAVLLAEAVKDDGVDYGELARGRAALDAYVRRLGEADPAATDAAFRINAYNAIVLRQVVDARPASVKDVDGFFDGRLWRVAGREVTLDGLEGEILASTGPLGRFALHRAARSSPPLSAALYRKDGLADALEQQTRAYLSDEERNVFRYAQLEAELSMLFFWHRADFEPLQVFLADHLPKVGNPPREGEIARSLRTTAWRVSFRPYDWALDEAGTRARRAHPVWFVLYGLAAAALLWLGARAFRSLLRRPA